MVTTRHLAIAIGQLVTLGLISACASAPPPRELLDARAAYARAQSGPAEQLAPATLHDAKTSLDLAERAYADDSSSPAARDLAYVAERRVELAETQAETSQAKQNARHAASQAVASTAAEARTAEGQLSRTREQLATTQDNLRNEQQAHAAAEQRAHVAFDQLAAVATNVAVKNDTRGTVITIPGSVLFPSGQAALLPSAQTSVEKVADALKNEPDATISVEGHTDSQGSEMKNMDLSTERAEHVRDYLVSHGVAQDHVKAQGFGAGHPLADNATPDGRATNRRVEIVVQPTEPR